jgi:vacuolar-type H+-ATPase subunit B/Vma2
VIQEGVGSLSGDLATVQGPDTGTGRRRLSLGLGLAPLTAVDAIMTPASQLPVAELTVSDEMLLDTSSNVTAYCGAQASRAMRFCSSRNARAGQLSWQILTCMTKV